MFKNIGRKIKTLALVLFWISLALGVIASLVGAIVMFAQGGRDEIYILFGFLVLIFGSAFSFLVSWIGSFFMYGFGQLIDDTEINRRTNEQILARLDGGAVRGGAVVRGAAPSPVIPRPVRPPVAETPAAPADPEDTWFCRRCGAKNEGVAKFCFRCGMPNDNA